MNVMSPSETTRKPAPAETYRSRTVTTKPLGAPSFVGSSESEYCVFDMQIGSPRSPFASASYSAILLRRAASRRVDAGAAVHLADDRLDLGFDAVGFASYRWRLAVRGRRRRTRASPRGRASGVSAGAALGKVVGGHGVEGAGFARELLHRRHLGVGVPCGTRLMATTGVRTPEEVVVGAVALPERR